MVRWRPFLRLNWSLRTGEASGPSSGFLRLGLRSTRSQSRSFGTIRKIQLTRSRCDWASIGRRLTNEVWQGLSCHPVSSTSLARKPGFETDPETVEVMGDMEVRIGGSVRTLRRISG